MIAIEFKEEYRNKMLNLWGNLQTKNKQERNMILKLIGGQEQLDYELIHNEMTARMNPNYKSWVIDDRGDGINIAKEVRR